MIAFCSSVFSVYGRRLRPWSTTLPGSGSRWSSLGAAYREVPARGLPDCARRWQLRRRRRRTRAADRLALVELARDGAPPRMVLRRGRAGAPRGARRAPARRRGVRRGDVVLTLIGNRPEWVVRDGRLLSPGLRRAALQRAAAREGPAPAPGRLPGRRSWSADERNRARARGGAAGTGRRAGDAVPDETLFAGDAGRRRPSWAPTTRA